MTPNRNVPQRPGLGLVQVSAAGLLWGTGGVVVTMLHRRDGMGAMTASAWRMAIAALALMLFVVAVRRWRPTWRAIRRHPLAVAAVGCGTAAYQGLYFVSVLMVGVSVATVIALGLAPLLAALWEHARGRTRPTATETAVLGAALTGLVLISATGGDAHAAGDRPTLGIALAVVAGATYAATTVLGHEMAQHVEPVLLTTGATCIGALALAPFFVVAAAAGGPVLPADTASVALVLYLGVMTMALAYGLLYAGLRTTSGSAATVATLVEPLSAALLAALLLSERLPWQAMMGGALILAAVAALGRRMPAAPPA